MNPQRLTEFLKTTTHAPCACVEFADFWRKFQEWLPADDRDKWTKPETGRQLRQHLELFNGARNKLMVLDIAFGRYAADPEANEERMNRHRDRAAFVDDKGRGFLVFHHHDGTWARVTIPNLITQLRWFGLSCEEIYRMRKRWRENPIQLSDLIAKCN